MFRHKKNILILALATALLFVFSLSPSYAWSPWKKKDSEAEQAATEEVHLIRHVMISPMQPFYKKLTGELIQRLSEQSGGRIKFEPYGVGELMSPADTLTALQKGIINTADVIPAYSPGLFPLAELFHIPRLISDWDIADRILSEMNQEYLTPEAAQNGVKPIYVAYTPLAQLWSKDPLKTFDDWKGYKMACSSEQAAKGLQFIGAAPQQIPGSEVFMALQKGVVNAWVTNPGVAFREALDGAGVTSVTILNFPQVVVETCVSLKTWNKLPPDLQQMLFDNIIWYNKENRVYMKQTAAEAMAYFEAIDGFSILNLDDSIDQKIAGLCKPLIDNWLSRNTKVGIKNAAEFKDEVIRLNSKYMAELRSSK